MENIYRIYYSGDAFGDNLFSAYLTKTLNDNGFKAFLDNPIIGHLVDCPKFNEVELDSDSINSFDCVRRNRTGLQTKNRFNVYSDLIEEFRKEFKIEKQIKIKDNHIPVNFHKLKNTPSFDVILVTETGYWTPYRNWPYFKELKKEFEKFNISYLDASEAGIRNNTLLNYIDNTKLYIGLETGASHYVSKVSNGKTLILQSGYTDFSYWAEIYDFDYLSIDVKCSPCWKREGCEHHICMKSLSTNEVVNKVLKILKHDLL
jgi:hypothetical protein